MNQARRLNIKVAGFLLALVLCVGLAFYGGRVYQNNVDQPLFTQYNPPTATGAGGAGGGFGGAGGTTGRTGSYFGGSSSGSSQIQAALAYATPPASSTQTTSSAGGQGSSSASGGQGSGSASGGQGSGSASGGQPGGSASGSQGSGSAPAASGTAVDSAELTGTLVSVGHGNVTIKTVQGSNQTVATSSSTTFYTAQAASGSAIAKGQKVTVSLAAGSSSQGFSAGDITIAPSGSLYGYVRQQQTASGGFGGFSPAGTVVSLSGNTLTLQTASGRSLSISVDSSTVVYRLVKTTGSAMHSGDSVTVLQSSGTGSATALNVVTCSLQGMIASLTNPPTRGAGGGFGGGQGGTGGYGGQSGQGVPSGSGN